MVYLRESSNSRGADIEFGVPVILVHVRGVDPGKTEITFEAWLPVNHLARLGVNVRWVEAASGNWRGYERHRSRRVESRTSSHQWYQTVATTST